MLRRVLVPLLVAAGFAVATSPSAFAANPPCTPAAPQQLASAHFVVLYNDDPANTASAGPAITATQAGTVLSTAEQQYNALAALGFPAPVNVGGKTYIHVVDLSSYNLSSWNCVGHINLDATKLADNFTLGFDIFEEIEYNYGAIDGWLVQGLASWGGWKSIGYPEQSTKPLGPWDMSLDCALSGSLTSQLCSTDFYTNLGLSRWPFYEYLAERFGNGFVATLLTDVNAAGGDGLAGLSTALATRGTTISAEYGAFTTKLLAGGWTAQQLNLTTPPTTGSPILTGTQTGDIPAQTFGVDHLATRFVQIDRGGSPAPLHCYAANLTLNVTIPAGVTSQPVFYWAQAGSTPVGLAISGQTATVTIPWDTCSWKIHGYLSLPNTSTSANSALFTVSGHLEVLSTEVTSTSPATPANGYGTATDVSSTDGAPAITVFGPLLLSLPSNAKQVGLVVQATGSGSLHAALGSVDLGSQKLRAGTNVVKYALPAGVLQRLRTSATAAESLLTLSPLSTDGSVAGTPVSLKVTVQPATKTKPKKHKK